MPTAFDAHHVRLSERDVERLEKGGIIIMEPYGDREKTIVIDSAKPSESQ